MRLTSASLSGLFHKMPVWNATRKENSRKHNAFVRDIEMLYNAGRAAFKQRKQEAITAAKTHPRERVQPDLSVKKF